MLQYNEIKLNNILYFKRSQLDLDYLGTTIVQGKNLNAKLKGRANGAGKSLLASSIASFKHGEPLGQRKYKHTLLDEDNASLELSVTKNGVKWDIRKYRKGKSVKWDILKDGISVEARTSTIAETMVSEILDQTEDEFYTLTYLDSRRLNLLQTGSVADRINYFTRLFRLNDFDNLKSIFNEQISDLRKSNVELKVIKEQYNDLLWVEDYEDQSSNIKSIKFKIKQLERKISYYDIQRKHEYILERYGHLKDFDFDLKKYKELRKCHNHNIRAKEYNKSYKDSKEAYNEWRILERKLQKEFKSKLKGWSLYEYCRDQIAKARVELNDYNKAQLRIAELKERQEEATLFKVPPKPEWDYDFVNSKLADLEEQQRNLEDTLEEYRKSKKKKFYCNCCGSKLTEESIKKSLARVQAELDVWEPRLLQIGTYRGKLKQYNMMWNPDLAEELLNLLDLDKPKLYRTKIDLKPVDKPSKKLAVVKYDVKEYKKLRSKYEDYKQYLKVKEELDEAINFKMKPKPDVNKLKKLSSRLATLESAQKQYKEAYSKYKELSKTIKRLNKDLKDLPLYEVLVDAYSNKGLKILVMKNLCNRIQKSLNKYSHLLFPEPFKFKLDVDLNKFDILVKRSDGRISDIRHLSGAESRAFSLLFMLAIMPLVPSNRRTNICILDEFEAGLDLPTRRLLVEQYLPVLNEIVPHILFITPNVIEPDEELSRRVITVVKSKDTAYIEI